MFLLAIAITVGLVNTFHNSGLIHSFCDKLHPYLVQYRVRGQNVKDVDTTQMKVFRDFIRSAPTQKAQHDLVRGIVTYRNDKSQIQIIPIINCDNL